MDDLRQRGFTIWQPWATLIMVGAKPYEFRPKSYQSYINAPAVGERVVIHAGARRIKRAEVEDLLERLDDPRNSTGLVAAIARRVLERCRAAYKYQALPLGCGLGTVVLGRPRNAALLFGGQVADSDRQALDFSAFNWAWPLTDIHPFDAPIPATGAQGFWTWNARKAA